MRLAGAPSIGFLVMGAILISAGLAAAQVAPSRMGPPTSEGLGERLSGESPGAATTLEIRRNAPTTAQAGPVDPLSYVLGPGDLLQLELWGKLVRSVILEVSPEGKIFLAGLGPVRVAGQTLQWAQNYVSRSVAATFTGVRSDLRLLRTRTFKVYVAGLVSRPGAVEVTPVTRVSEALAQVGLVEGSSRRNILVGARDGSTMRVDLKLFESTGRQDFDPLLEDGDVILVPRATQFVDVSGAAVSVGRYELAPNDSLSTLAQIIGGFVPAASIERALLVRFRTATDRESLWLDLGQVTSGVTNFPLRDGDHLYAFFVSGFHDVPQVEIYGEVTRPGTYPIRVGQNRLSQLIGWAEGFRPDANRSILHLLRMPDGTKDGDPEFDRLVRLSRSEMTESEYAVFRTKLSERKNSFRIDYDRLQKRDPDNDPLLRPGDIVRVDPLLLTVRVEGEVRRPGLVDFAAGRSLDKYMALAGGLTDRASRSRVKVSRSLTGQVIPAKSVGEVQPGDFIWVPERHDVDAWQIFRDVVAVAGQVAVVWLAIRR